MMRYILITAALLLLFNAGCTAPEPSKPAALPVPPSPAQLVERGRYLVGIMGCNDCHSPKIMTPQGPVPDPDRLLSGHPANEPGAPADGNAGKDRIVFSMDLTSSTGPWGTSYSGNLTSDATGIGNWSEEQFKRAITKGLFKGLEGSRPLLPPMPWQNLTSLTDADIHAIFTYLRSTRPVENVVPAPLPPAAH